MIGLERNPEPEEPRDWEAYEDELMDRGFHGED